jgi:SAM-dependent methyltransferase
MKKIYIMFWFILRPKYWEHFIFKIWQKFLKDYDSPEYKAKALEWANLKAVTTEEALLNIGIKGKLFDLDKNIIIDAKKKASSSPIKMGGSAHLNLLYNSVRLLGAEKVLETGVAYGWSSLGILKALSENKRGNLYSVDMPYPTRNNDKYVGIVVPKNLRNFWVVIKKPDRPGIKEALKLIDGKIDLCHYDSDKSWWGRAYAYSILWDALKPGGLFISDDIVDNLYFSYFVNSKSLNYAVINYKGKFIGLIRKT